MKKGAIYKFKIDVFTPETLPMARCAEYLANLANVLGETANVHFVKVDPGCAQLVHRIDYEAIPKVKKSIQAVKNGKGTATQIQSNRKLNRMLQDDNATASLNRGKNKVLLFPGKAEDAVKTMTIRQSGELVGELNRIGGSKDIVHITINSEGSDISNINVNRNIAKDLGKHLFDQIKLYGDGKWERDAEGVWDLIVFTVHRFDILEEIPLSQTVLKLRGLKGGWGKSALSEILESRKS